VAVTPDGSRIVSGGREAMYVWDLASGRLEQKLTGPGGWVGTLTVTPDGRRVVSDGDDTVRVWDLETGRLERTLQGHEGPVNGIAVALDGTRIISASDDGTLRAWDIATGLQIACWHAEPGMEVTACCTVPGDPSLFVLGIGNAGPLGAVHLVQLVENSRL
jgi:WD40 repeat protein